MPDNNIDNIFKQKIEQLEQKDLPFDWDKENSWDRLQRKKKLKSYRKLIYYAAAILIIGLLAGNINRLGFVSSEKSLNENYANVYQELQKRQKLKEIEQ